jgi:hypothetical protein
MERKAPPQAPLHFHSPYSYPDNNSEPWFLYGHGKELRQMGVIPSNP